MTVCGTALLTETLPISSGPVIRCSTVDCCGCYLALSTAFSIFSSNFFLLFALLYLTVLTIVFVFGLIQIFAYTSFCVYLCAVYVCVSVCACFLKPIYLRFWGPIAF
jgi:hypothetical protein